jgi:hypothetical protein
MPFGVSFLSLSFFLLMQLSSQSSMEAMHQSQDGREQQIVKFFECEELMRRRRRRQRR